MTDTTKEKKKWGGGFGKLLRKDNRDTSPVQGDSTYGSNDSNRDSYNSSIPSVIGSDSSNSKEQPATRQVINADGHVVTTTTTTTTTTTSSNNQHSDTTSSEKPAAQASPPASKSTPEPYGGNTPNVPPRSDLRPSQQQQLGGSTSPSGGRQDYNPSQAHHGQPNTTYGQSNAPYPAQPQQGQQGTLGGIKAAAAGVHGAGEMLRGTLNSTVDKRFHTASSPAQQAANEEAIRRGEREMETGRLQHQRDAHPPPGSHPPTAGYSAPPVGEGMNQVGGSRGSGYGTPSSGYGAGGPAGGSAYGQGGVNTYGAGGQGTGVGGTSTSTAEGRPGAGWPLKGILKKS